MRYFLVTYLRKADGKIDEQVTLANSIKLNDQQTCNIILDFKEKKVEKSVIQGQHMPKDWDKMIEYYTRAYPDYIAELEKLNAAE
jgi:hypothetical protein